jgi:ectoine hydroxylase-related dioxygenase (phytanoyl-CoA dioxygenase family)
VIADFALHAHAENIRRDGYTVIEDFLDAATLAQVRAGVAPHLGSHRGRNGFEGFTTERIYTLVARGKVFERIAADERLLALIGQFLSPQFLLSASQAILINPGEVQQALHHDDSFYKVPRPRPPLGISMITAIDDFTHENGATEIVPGSHTWGPADEKSLPEALAAMRPALLKAGSCIVFLGTFIHGGGANRSNASRLAITFQYCEGWLRQQENFFLAIPREIAAGMSPRLQELIGYSIWPPFMGMVTAYDPKRVLDDDFVLPVASEPHGS